MTNYTPSGFGLAVQKKREALGIQQEEFGTRVGYKAGPGASVSISRVETGRTLPPATRREAIAKELGLSYDELEAFAAKESQALAAKAPASLVSTTPQKQSVRDRAESLHRRIETRKERVESLGSKFAEAHQEASESFYLPFMEFAKTINDAVAPEPPTDSELQALSKAHTPVTLAEIKVRTLKAELGRIAAGVAAGAVAGAGIGAISAYGTYQGFAWFGSASTGMENRLLYGAALSNSILAGIGGGPKAYGGGGIKGGTSVLVATVAIPALAGAIVGGFMADQRRRQEVAKINAELDVIEAELNDTMPGIKKLRAAIPQATETLRYINVHATHAFEKWKGSFGEPPHAWDAMSDEQKKQFEDLLEVAACELVIVGLQTGQYLNLRNEQLDEFSLEIDAVIEHTDDRVRTLV